jgi:CheY-like chemotaxis protein
MTRVSIASQRPFVALVVEDNPADVVFLKEAIEAGPTRIAVQVVGNGEDAMRFLRRQGPFSAAPRPDVVMMDLNVPLKSGKEVLQEMAAEPALRTIPVAILTTSSSESHVTQCYTPGRCLYLVKTDDFGQLQEMVGRIISHALMARDRP